jgi:hypothetical protein
MFRSVLVVLGLCAIAALGQTAHGQAASPLAIGTHVRVVLPAQNGGSEQHLAGSLARLEGDTVVLWSGGFARPDSLTIVLNEGRRLEVLQASHGHGGTGAAFGALLGALVGGVLASATWHDCTQGLGCIGSPTQGEQAAGGAFLGAAGGALMGLVIGSSIRSEIWVPVETSGVHVSIAPRGIGIIVRL